MNVADWTPTPIRTSWDDLLDGVDSAGAWKEKRKVAWQHYLSILRDEAAPERPKNLQVEVEREWHTGEFTIRYISYQVEADERAHAHIDAPDDPAPQDGFPGVACLHGITN